MASDQVATQTGLHELLQQLNAIGYGIWRKRWAMIISAWMVAVAVWAAVFTIPYRYEASAQVYIDTDTALPALARNLGIQVDVQRKVDLIRNTLIVRPNLERIIQRSDYLERLASDGRSLDQLVTDMQRNIRVTSLDANRFEIVYEMGDARLTDRQRAEVARTVVNNLLAFFLETNSEDGRLRTENAQVFLENQIAEYASRLEEADQALAGFRQTNLAYLGGQAVYLTRLREAQTQLRDTRQDIIEQRVALEELEKQLGSVPATVKLAVRGGQITSAPKSLLDERIDELTRKLDTLRSFGYTDRHPDVESTLVQLKGLQDQKKVEQEEIEREVAEANAAGRAATRADEAPNPLYEQLYLQVVEARQNMARLDRRETDQLKQVTEMEVQAKRVPEIEAEEKRLSRDYDTIQKRYTDLIAERESLSLKQSVEGVGEDLSLRIIEPPVTPQAPSGPPRLLYLSAGLFAALLAGVGIAFFLSQIRPIVISVDQLKAHFALPVLGGITRVTSQEDARKQSMGHIAFASATIALFVVFFALTLLDIFGAPTLTSPLISPSASILTGVG